MRFVLHVGQTKAGSTSIQSFLQLNYHRLLREGVCYPGGDRGPRHVQHSWVVQALASAPEKVEAMLRKSCGAHTAIISGEILINMPADSLERLHGMMDRENADEIRVVLYVRNIADRLLSRQAQKAKHGNYLYPEFAQILLRNRDTVLSLPERISMFEAEFGVDKVDVRLFEEARPLEMDLLACAGAEWSDDYVLPPPANVSPDPIRAQILTLLKDEFGWAGPCLLDPHVTLPHIENANLRRLEPLVTEADLDHPKLARFRDRLTEIRWRDDVLQPQPTDYIEGLIATLTALRKRASYRRTKREAPLQEEAVPSGRKKHVRRQHKRKVLRGLASNRAPASPQS